MKRLFKRWPAFVILSAVALFCYGEIRLASDRDSQGYLTKYRNTEDAGITGPPIVSPGFGQSILDTDITDDTVAYWALEDLTDEVGSHTLTNNGSATFTNTGLFGNCVTLNGSTQYLTALDHADWDLSNSDFAISFWTKFSSLAANNYAFMSQLNELGTGNSAWYVRWYNGDLGFAYSTNGTANTFLTFSWTPSTNIWYHITVVRDGADLKAFVDGSQVGSTQNISTDTIYNSTLKLTIGAVNQSIDDSILAEFMNGDIDEVIVSKGMTFTSANEVQEVVSSLYENGTGINWKSDQAEVNGNDSNTVLYLTGGGADGATVTQDLGAGTTKHPVTFVGDAQIDTAQSIYGNASYLFDKVSDSMLVTGTDLDLGSGDFTLEAWIYPKTDTTQMTIMGTREGDSIETIHYTFDLAASTKKTYFVCYDTSNTVIISFSSTGAVTLNAWNHVAISRSGSTFYLAVNGTVNSSVGNTNAIWSGTWIRIGESFNVHSSNNPFDGNMAHIMESSTAKYTANYTVPDSSFYPLDWKWDNDSDVKLLLHNDDTGLTDSSASSHIITLNGSAVRSSTYSKFGGYSAYLPDTSTDTLAIANSDDFLFPGDFAIDTLVRCDSGEDASIYVNGILASNTYLAINYDKSNNRINLYVDQNATPTVINSIDLSGSMHHIALVRTGSTMSFYVDGISKWSATKAGTKGFGNNATTNKIGGGSVAAIYVDEFRISKGVPRWKGKFIVPFVPYGTTWGE